MEVELLEIRQFLEQRNPFSYLSPELLDELPKDIEIRYLRRGGEFPPREGFLYVVRSGAVKICDKSGELCEKLGEGDIYSVTCQLVQFDQCDHGEALEDTLLYLLSCDRLKALCRASTVFSEHFSATVKDRLKAAVTTTQESNDPSVAAMMVAVGSLVRKQPITVQSGMTIRETAAMMSNKDVSSVMVMHNEKLVGLVTDRDLRKRCVAIGLNGAEPIDQIMTPDPKTIEASTLTAQALMTMTRMRFHHLPVTEHGKLIGMITATDLANHQSANSAYLAADVRKAKTVADLIEVSKRLPSLHMRLATASVTARHIGEAVSCLTDSITGRLLEMAEAELGPPPVPYVWMAGGSQARHEQSSHSDQDNALLLSNDFDTGRHDAYFAALAKFVSDGLNACGFVYCPGDAMATNPQWRQPLKVWQGYFSRWIESPDPMSMMLSSIFFDLRPVTGAIELFTPLQQMILKKSQHNRIFLAYMMANAMQHRPPLGFFRQFVLERGGEHDDTLDLKHRGIVPITDIARLLALSLGKEPVNTVERLRACAGTPALSTDMAENLEDALEFIASLRIQHQAHQIRHGMKADNYVPPGELSELEREHLKHAFKVIQSMQETMVKRFGAEQAGVNGLFARFLGKEYQRRQALAKVSPGPLADYLATPFPDKKRDCRELEIVAIDLETTGLDPRKDEILSIGMVNIDHFGVKLATAWHSIVRIHREIPGESAIIHQITDDQSAAGRPIDELLPEVLRRLAGKPMLVHYSPIEQNFISAACKKLYGAPFVIPIIDTLEIGQRVFARRNHTIQAGDLRLFNLRPRYNLPQYKAHNALTDALATAELFLAMVDNLYPERPCPLGEFLSNR